MLSSSNKYFMLFGFYSPKLKDQMSNPISTFPRFIIIKKDYFEKPNSQSHPANPKKMVRFGSFMAYQSHSSSKITLEDMRFKTFFKSYDFNSSKFLIGFASRLENISNILLKSIKIMILKCLRKIFQDIQKMTSNVYIILRPLNFDYK